MTAKLKHGITKVKDPGSALTHFIAMILAIIAAMPLLSKAGHDSGHMHISALAVFILSMIGLYAASTIYHTLDISPKINKLLRKIDHMMIFILIAGTYTPFTLLVLRHAGGWGWGIFTFVWLSAIAGFILSFKKLKEHSNLETVCYVGMGACILVAMKPLLDQLEMAGASPAFWWLIGGGISYITGAVFYSLRKPYMHAAFHLFCLGGSVGHIVAIWLVL